MEHEDCLTNYAHDTTSYVIANNTPEAIQDYQYYSGSSLLPNNQMKADPDICHLRLSTQKQANVQIAIMTIKYSQSKKTIGNNT